MQIYSRAHKIAEGKRLVAEDHATLRAPGGGLRWNAIGSFAANTFYRAHPANVMQIPPSPPGPGGFTSPPSAGTSPMAIMAAQQQQRADGGLVEDPETRARRILHETIASEIPHRANGGAVPRPIMPREKIRSATEILNTWKKIERQMKGASPDAQYSRLCECCPEVKKLLKILLRFQGFFWKSHNAASAASGPARKGR